MSYFLAATVLFFTFIFSHPFQVSGNSRLLATANPNAAVSTQAPAATAKHGNWLNFFKLYQVANTKNGNETSKLSNLSKTTLAVKAITATQTNKIVTSKVENVTPPGKVKNITKKIEVTGKANSVTTKNPAVAKITKKVETTGKVNLITTKNPAVAKITKKIETTRKANFLTLKPAASAVTGKMEITRKSNLITTQKPAASVTAKWISIAPNKPAAANLNSLKSKLITTVKPNVHDSVCSLPKLPKSLKNIRLANIQFKNARSFRKSARDCKGIRWQKATSKTWNKVLNKVPLTNAKKGSREEPRYICRVSCKDQTFPGELNPQTGTCLYTNHLSHEATDFQLLVNPCGLRLGFRPLSRPQLPSCPVIGGVEQHNPENCDGRKLGERASFTFIGRTVVTGARGARQVAGKVTADRKIYYSAGNAEDVSANFEVLVLLP